MVYLYTRKMFCTIFTYLWFLEQTFAPLGFKADTEIPKNRRPQNNCYEKSDMGNIKYIPIYLSIYKRIKLKVLFTMIEWIRAKQLPYICHARWNISMLMLYLIFLFIYLFIYWVWVYACLGLSQRQGSISRWAVWWRRGGEGEHRRLIIGTMLLYTNFVNEKITNTFFCNIYDTNTDSEQSNCIL